MSVFKIVITGGPCAGKTTITQVIERAYPNELVIVPEAASLLFSGGFPRWEEKEAQQATQRAIFHIQHEIESAYAAKYPTKIHVLDRGSIDGAAYWPNGESDFFAAMNTSLDKELKRYDSVIYLASASRKDYVSHKDTNPNRNENWDAAAFLDKETQRLWQAHPSFSFIEHTSSFSYKISEVLAQISEIISKQLKNKDLL